MSAITLRILPLLLLVIASTLAAQQRYPYYPGAMPYPYALPQGQPGYAQPRSPTSPRPNGSPAAPATGQQRYPYAPAQGYPQPPAQSRVSSAPPRLQLELPGESLYAQQTAILTLDLVSATSVARVDVDLPNSDALLFSRLQGPTLLSHSGEGQRLVVNRFHFAITPLKPGSHLLPEVTVSGQLADGRATRFELTEGGDRVLRVRPIDPAVRPWLPLHGLTLQSYLQGDDRPREGKPLTMVIDVSAVGASGTQLPSFADRIDGHDFRVYLEKLETEGRVSADGRYLVGHRTETFTLVPLHGNKLQIPALNIDWWNVDTHRAERAFVPIRQLVATGTLDKRSNQVTDLFPGAKQILVWVPLVLLFSITIGFWVLAWLRRKRFMLVVEEELALVLAVALEQSRRLIVWLAPIRRLQRLRQLFVRSLPRSFRLWFCVKVVDGESDPGVWSYMLRFLANKHLGIPPQLPLRQLGERLCDIHAGADPEQMQGLMQQLDAVLYGDRGVDFTLWKRQFRRQLRPVSLHGSRQAATSARRRRLPRLNPGD